MPDHIPRVPTPRTYAKRPQGKTSDRGYGTNHQKLRKLVLAQQPVCAHCESAWSYHLHHIDHNPHNRKRENVVGLCEQCHLKVHD